MPESRDARSVPVTVSKRDGSIHTPSRPLRALNVLSAARELISSVDHRAYTARVCVCGGEGGGNGVGGGGGGEVTCVCVCVCQCD